MHFQAALFVLGIFVAIHGWLIKTAVERPKFYSSLSKAFLDVAGTTAGCLLCFWFGIYIARTIMAGELANPEERLAIVENWTIGLTLLAGLSVVVLMILAWTSISAKMRGDQEDKRGN